MKALHKAKVGVLLALLVAGCTADSGEATEAAADAGGEVADDPGAPDAVPSGDAEGPEIEESGRDALPSAGDVPPVHVEMPSGVATPENVSSRFDAREVIGQLYVWNAEPELEVEVVGPDGEVLASAPTDYQGSLVFRELEPRDGYVLRPKDDPDDFTGPLTVLSKDGSLPEEAFYSSQVLGHGFQYLTMRDGTKLSAFVSLPGPPEEGPYPTLVNYSGYSPSRPGEIVAEEVKALCPALPILCEAPHFPTGLIMGIAGYAVVGVNVRGTGCSGGAYDYFDVPQLVDGYDVIEIVAHQPWVKHNKVGMTGLSFPGITQLFVAAQRPPSLAAISPMSVIADTGSSTLLPGGIYNNGFALSWIKHVLKKAEPYAHNWITKLVDDGDTVCEENQKLHSQLFDAVTKALENPFYSDEVAKPVDPTSFVHLIEVPVFLSGQAQDEQTGPHFPALFDKFESAPIARFTMTNGVHGDGFAFQVIMEWANFLDLYVAREIPSHPSILSTVGPIFMERAYGAPIDAPPQRFESYTSYEEALAAYEAEPPLRVIFESGAAPEVEAGAPQGTFEERFESWPIPGTVATRWYLQPDGGLGDAPPGPDGGASSFEPDPEAGGRGTLASGSIDNIQPGWDWQQPVEGKALSYTTEPLEADHVLIGHGSADLWLKSTATDADLEICLSEVRADGKESYVQCGWLRASHRKLRHDATELRPVKSHRLEDIEPIVAGEWTELRVELMPVSHIFREGSRIRLVIDTPGDSMASWRFLLLEHEELPTHTISHDEARPSSVVLSVVPGIEVPTELPDCKALRGQPCREHVAYENTRVQ